jgi:hypothetical protein
VSFPYLLLTLQWKYSKYCTSSTEIVSYSTSWGTQGSPAKISEAKMTKFGCYARTTDSEISVLCISLCIAVVSTVSVV